MELVIIIPVVIALVEAAKRSGMNSRYAIGVSLLLGIAAVMTFGEGEMLTRLWEGIIAGLSASGLYSGVKAQVK